MQGMVSHLNYYSTLYDGLPAARLGCLDRILRAAGRLIGNIPRFGQVSVYMRMFITGSLSRCGSLSTGSALGNVIPEHFVNPGITGL